MTMIVGLGYLVRLRLLTQSCIFLTYGDTFLQSAYPFHRVNSLRSAFLSGLTPPVGMQVYNSRNFFTS